MWHGIIQRSSHNKQYYYNSTVDEARKKKETNATLVDINVFFATRFSPGWQHGMHRRAIMDEQRRMQRQLISTNYRGSFYLSDLGCAAYTAYTRHTTVWMSKKQ